MFPLCFVGVTFATQMPMLIVLNQQTEVTPLSYAAAFTSIALGCTVIALTLRALPLPLPGAASGGRDNPRERLVEGGAQKG